MKIIPKLAICLLAICAASYAAPDILRIKLEWLNAKDCGFDGCKPQSVIMRAGSSMTFGWRPGSGLEERGLFELFPSIHEESVKLKIRRKKASDTIAEEERMFAIGAPQEMALREVELRITITEEEPTQKK